MQPSFKKAGAAIHPMVFSLKAKLEKLEDRVKVLENASRTPENLSSEQTNRDVLPKRG